MKVESLVTQNPHEIALVRAFILQHGKHEHHPGFFLNTYGNRMDLRYEYTDLDVDTDNYAVADEDHAALAGDMIKKFNEFCKTVGKDRVVVTLEL